MPATAAVRAALTSPGEGRECGRRKTGAVLRGLGDLAEGVVGALRSLPEGVDRVGEAPAIGVVEVERLVAVGVGAAGSPAHGVIGVLGGVGRPDRVDLRLGLVAGELGRAVCGELGGDAAELVVLGVKGARGGGARRADRLHDVAHLVVEVIGERRVGGGGTRDLIERGVGSAGGLILCVRGRPQRREGGSRRVGDLSRVADDLRRIARGVVDRLGEKALAVHYPGDLPLGVVQGEAVDVGACVG